MFTDIAGSGTSSRSSSFRRPGGHPDTPSTPSPKSNPTPPQNRRFDSLRLPSQAASPLAQSHTPTNIPSVMTPVSSKSSRALSPSSLNRLQAKVLRAKLMGADTKALEREYDEAVRLANGDGESHSGIKTKVEVLPTLDGKGRLYDVGSGKDDGQVMPGNRKRKHDKVANASFFITIFSLLMNDFACSWRREILGRAKLSGITLTTIRRLWEICSDTSGLERV